jgi:predicted deacylase
MHPLALFAIMTSHPPYCLLLALAVLLGSCAASRGNVYPLGRGYLKESDLLPKLQGIAAADPGLAGLHIIGFSGTENLPIYGLYIGSPQPARKVLMIGQHHGDEVLGLELVLEWAQRLAAKSGSDRRIRAILESCGFWIVPTLNPEAYRVVSSGAYQFKRKTNRDTDGNGVLDLRTDGVDLNRNYPVFWDEDPVTSVTNPNYKGTAPASEAEVQAILALAQRNRFDLALFFHSSASGAYSEKIFLPAIDPANGKQKARQEALVALLAPYAADLKRDYARGHYALGTQFSSRVGNARNYFFHLHGCDAFLVEIGGIKKEGVSVIHPPDAKKREITAMHLKALRNFFYGYGLKAGKGDQ